MKVVGIPESATSCKIGLEPSEGSGLVEIIDDPDKNFAAYITDKDVQDLVIETTDGTTTIRKVYDLSPLVCETE